MYSLYLSCTTMMTGSRSVEKGYIWGVKDTLFFTFDFSLRKERGRVVRGDPWNLCSPVSPGTEGLSNLGYFLIGKTSKKSHSGSHILTHFDAKKGTHSYPYWALLSIKRINKVVTLVQRASNKAGRVGRSAFPPFRARSLALYLSDSITPLTLPPPPPTIPSMELDITWTALWSLPISIIQCTAL